VKLVVDEMYSPVLAEQLRARGHDVVAVGEVAGLAGASDAALLDWAQRHRRALVTENAADFLPLHAAALQGGEPHAGIVFTSNASFPRGRASTIGALVRALDTLMRETPDIETDVRWLP
jgi:predicted nuclease of predicted toxin-antitoxin system